MLLIRSNHGYHGFGDGFLAIGHTLDCSWDVRELSMLWRKRWRWFICVERKDGDWIKRCTTSEVGRMRQRWCPRKTVWDGVKRWYDKFWSLRGGTNAERQSSGIASLDLENGYQCVPPSARKDIPLEWGANDVTATLSSSVSFKSRMVLPFWCRLTQTKPRVCAIQHIPVSVPSQDKLGELRQEGHLA